MQGIDEERLSILRSQLDSATLSALRAAYPPGAPVEIIQAEGLNEGTRGVVQHVNADGTVVVLLADGTVHDLAFRKESARRLIESGCILQKREWKDGGCEKDRCTECGWNAEVSLARTKSIRENGLRQRKDGKKQFIIRGKKH